ncbi:MAG: hypothetical protein AAB631_00700 [Patescibacteria group bacterium]
MNIVFLFREGIITPPSNEALIGLFQGDASRGVHLLDDTAIGTKMLDVPSQNVQVFWEGRRLRIEDKKNQEPDESSLFKSAWDIFEKLFPEKKEALEGVGANFDLYYQFSDVIRLEEIFSRLHPTPKMLGDSLLDFGWQWTVGMGDGSLEGYFVKITAPLELAVHFNKHLRVRALPRMEEFATIMKGSYRNLDHTIGGLAL